MPGLRALDDAAFIRSFRAIDGVIQGRQPVFMAVWLGAVVTLVTAAVSGGAALDPTGRWLLYTATGTYLLGVQVPTFAVNVPLNDALQRVRVEALDEVARAAAREAFEGRWNRWNLVRTVAASATSLLLIVAILRS